MKKGVLILGDLMLGRDMVKEIEEKGLQYYFDPIKHLMQDRYTIANLEGVLADDLKPREDVKNPLIAPTWMAERLKAVGVDAVSLANNHIMDCGEEGKEITKNHLSDNNVRYFDDKNILIKIKDRVISFDSGCAPFDIQFISKFSNYRIFMPHSGIELFQYPLPKDEGFYKGLIEHNYVDLIAGSHSHCIQAGERHNDGFIFYGLGDFISDCSKNYDLFWQENAHPKKFGLGYEKHLLARSLMIDVDFESYEPKVKVYTFNRNLNEIVDNSDFAHLSYYYMFDNKIKEERIRVEKELCKTLKE
ncbi:hypothetical protein LCGC14_1757450 [marine sediment metagenome]|uniref:Capsule synthesis protein CapA domain-containing protein n=1 Tax=marine sediment metagenome TaxID=412755 RepID=A0A0F9H228_9ZZZZ